MIQVPYQPRPLSLAPHRSLLPPSKADLIPVEILSEIFLLIVQDWSGYRKYLELVCRRWHAIILSTPSIHSQLTIRRATQKEVVQAFIQGRKSRLDVMVNMSDEKDGNDFNPENFLASFTAAAQVASRWSSLNLISPPTRGKYKALQILQPLVHLESFKLASGFGEFVEPLMNAISRSASPNLTTMDLGDPVAVLYLVRPACLHITHSLRILRIGLSKKMDSPTDILPHFHRLEVFGAYNLCLPFYPPDATFPLTQTLRSLNLTSVSVQWMAGHVFTALEKCEIKLPHDADFIQALRPVSMPSCSRLVYYSNDLHPLAHYHLPPLHELCVRSGQWNARRGNLQLVALCPVVAAGAQRLTDLRLEVDCNEKLLVYMLSLVPALRQLWLGLARPNALSTTFFRAFIDRKLNADGASDVVGPPNQTITPICPSLFLLSLHYRRWLRGPDKMPLIVALGDIVASRDLECQYSFSLKLSIDRPHDSLGFLLFEAFKPSWSIGKPVRKFQYLGNAGVMLGISTPHGIIPVSTALPPNGLLLLPFREADCLRLRHFDVDRSFEFVFTHDHMELMVHLSDRPPPTSMPCDLPLFHTLRILVVENANPSFLAGHTFHNLERCRVVKSHNAVSASPDLFTETEMPVCTRVDIDDPYLLAGFKLPQLCELSLDFSHPDCITIWEKRIAVNVNLSGLNLLHVKKWPLDGDLIPILRSLPLFKSLVICSRLGVVSFRAFLPMDTNGTSGLEQTSSDGRTSTLLCPRLQYLHIEGQDPSLVPELMLILKDIVTFRAACKVPLKELTFFNFWPGPGCKTELIGRDQSFTMEKYALEEEEFKLDI